MALLGWCLPCISRVFPNRRVCALLRNQVEDKFLPGVYDRVSASLSKVSLSNALVDDVIAAALALAEKKRTVEVCEVDIWVSRRVNAQLEESVFVWRVVRQVERVRKEREAEAKRLADEADAKRRAEQEAKEKARLAAEAEAKSSEEGGGEGDE
jgi:hypothetical protein